ncbi:site-specific integrase [Rhizobium sp. rho-13.1]|uniref:tyrosine-type recombinase/integrase n=1 Tax=Rhizobium sp. rho-13.1 TaxID=2506431 RepID=UPI00115E273B|nr:site-specific integrase [Rhizobium sp. rho-13.1]TQX91345.1 site-specific integrase [Rhizobium sp. rho-13.1]
MAAQGLANIRYVINNDDPIPTQKRLAKTFADAAASYLGHGGSHRYLDRIVEYLADQPIDSIVPFDIKEMAKALFPGVTNATKNRQVLTPVRAVINHANERGWCNYIRIKNFKEDAPKRKLPAPPVWLQLFVRECDRSRLPHVAALVLFMAHTGARVSEAVALEWSEVDLQSRTALLLKTKTERNSTRHLTDELVNRLHVLRQARSNRNPARVFTFKCRYSVNERIEAVCSRAGITYKSSHACGRHTFATTAIDMGLDIPTAMAAGGWKSSAIFLGVYVTPRRNAGRMTADRFNEITFDKDV